MNPMPAWLEILLLNYREQLAGAVSEADVRQALAQALRDTATEVAGSLTILDQSLAASRRQ